MNLLGGWNRASVATTGPPSVDTDALLAEYAPPHVTRQSIITARSGFLRIDDMKSPLCKAELTVLETISAMQLASDMYLHLCIQTHHRGMW